MRIPISQAQERTAFSIIDGARFSLEQVQYLSSIDENRPLGIETDEVQKFLFYWDQVFLYGLKSAKNGYWNFVSAFSHPSLVNEVKNTPGAVNDLLRSRLWLGTILNENELENYLTLVQFEHKLLAKYYRPHAILRNRSQLEDLISISCGQENTLFAIHLDYICFRAQQLFVGPGDRTYFDKMFDIKFNWDESVRTRSSSSVSVASNFFSRTPSYSRPSYNSFSGSTPVGDLALNPENMLGSDIPLSRDLTSISDQGEFIQFSPTAQLAASASASPIPERRSLTPTPILESSDITTVSEIIARTEIPAVTETPAVTGTSAVTYTVSGSDAATESPAETEISTEVEEVSSSFHHLSDIPESNDPYIVESSSVSTSVNPPDDLVSSSATVEQVSLESAPSTSEIFTSQTSTPVPTLEEVLQNIPIRISISDHSSANSECSTSEDKPPPTDYTTALVRGDQLALSPGNLLALGTLIQQSASDPEEIQSAESYEVSDSEKELQQAAESEREMHALQVADFLVEEVMLETGGGSPTQRGALDTEDLYSDPESEDMFLPPDDTEEMFLPADTEDHTVQHSTPGSDPYMLDSGAGSPTLLITDLIPTPSAQVSASSWYDNDPVVNQHEENIPVENDSLSEENLPEEIPPEDSLPKENDGSGVEADTMANRVEEREETLQVSEDFNPFSESNEDGAADENITNVDAAEEPQRSSSVSMTKEKEVHIEVPDLSYGTMDRELGVVIASQNQKISWAVELFGDNEDLCFIYRVWLKDSAGNLELSYFLLTTKMIYLLDPLYLVKQRLRLDRVQYGRGINWQVITLFALQEDGTTDQIDVITGCEAISRGVMEGISVNPSYPVNWAVEDSYSQMRLKYHVNAFLQERGAFSMRAMDDLYYGSVSYLSLTAPPASALHCPISEGLMWLKEPTLLSYVWNQYYFILDKQGTLSQLDAECTGTIKKEYTVIGSGACRKMTRKETTKQCAFKFISEEGTEVLLNCENALERDRWMTAISKAAMEIPQSTNETGYGMQCSAVISSSYLVLVREGVKSAHTLDSALIQDITEIRWDSDHEMCVVTIDKRQWLILFRDNYEKTKLMECVWERWQEIFRCHDLQLLFSKVNFSELGGPLDILGRYRNHLLGIIDETDKLEFECV